MTAPEEREAVGEQEAREIAAFLVIAERGHAGARLHLPAADCDREAPMPLCHYEGRVDAWRAKDPAVYPPGYRPFCRRCLVALADQAAELAALPAEGTDA